MKNIQLVDVVVAIVITAIVGGVLYVGLRPQVGTLGERSATATGVALTDSRWESCGGKCTARHAEVEFVDIDGEIVRTRVRTGKVSAGDTVEVIYEIARPSNARAAGNRMTDPKVIWPLAVVLLILYARVGGFSAKPERQLGGLYSSYGR